MKQAILTVLAMVISVNLFAIAPAGSDSNSKAIANVWKSYKSASVPQDRHDLAIVYGGEDVSSKALSVINPVGVA